MFFGSLAMKSLRSCAAADFGSALGVAADFGSAPGAMSMPQPCVSWAGHGTLTRPLDEPVGGPLRSPPRPAKGRPRPGSPRPCSPPPLRPAGAVTVLTFAPGGGVNVKFDIAGGPNDSRV